MTKLLIGFLFSLSCFAQQANVKTNCGAVGNNVTNDKPAFDTCFTALKAGTYSSIYVPTGTYVYNSSSSFGDGTTFSLEASNYTIFGDGAALSIIKFTGQKGLYTGNPRVDINRYCTTPPSTMCAGPLGWTLPTYYLIGNASSGASSVTLTTAAQASNFTPGGVVFIESGNADTGTGNPPAHFEYNVVATSNTMTGVVTFASPLTDSYDSTQNASYLPMMTQISIVPSNYVIHDLGFTSTVADTVLLAPQGSRNVDISNCAFTNMSSGNAFQWPGGYSTLVAIRNCTFDGVSSDAGDALSYWTHSGNTILNSSGPSLGGSGSIRNWIISGNTFTGISVGGDAQFGIGIFGTDYIIRGLSILSNTINLSATPLFGGGMHLGGTSSAVVQGNRINGAAVAGQLGIWVDTGSTNTALACDTYSNMGAGTTVRDNGTGTITTSACGSALRTSNSQHKANTRRQ